MIANAEIHDVMKIIYSLFVRLFPHYLSNAFQVLHIVLTDEK